MIENLKEAIMGNYQSIVSLTAVLESGTFSKKLLDTVIDKCKFLIKYVTHKQVKWGVVDFYMYIADAVINLRETILTNRIRQTGETSPSDYDKNTYLSKALAGLQRYFFLLCFTAYVNESPNTRFETRFSSWVRARTEIWAMLQNMRRKGPRLYFFRPVEDLHQLIHPHHKRGHGLSKVLSHEQGMFEMKGAGSQANDVITVEMEQFIINVK